MTGLPRISRIYLWAPLKTPLSNKKLPEIGSYLKNSLKMVNVHAFVLFQAHFSSKGRSYPLDF